MRRLALLHNPSDYRRPSRIASPMRPPPDPLLLPVFWWRARDSALIGTQTSSCKCFLNSVGKILPFLGRSGTGKGGKRRVHFGYGSSHYRKLTTYLCLLTLQTR